MRAAADKFNWFLVRVPLIITGPLGKKKRAMIFAQFSTPGTFPRKLRGEFRAPFSATGCSRFSALYLNARRISRAGGNALLKSAIFYPIFPSYFLALRSPSRSRCLVCVRTKLLRSFVNCFRATRTRKPTREWMKRRTKERKTTGGENFSRESGGEVNVLPSGLETA